MSASKYYDHNDHVSARVPKRRKVDLEFDEVRSIGDKFYFHLKGRLICSIEKNYFQTVQADFFEGISQT